MENARPTPFLRLVANDLIKRFGTNLAELTVVFPNKRARLFLNRYLYETVNHPLWSPQYLSIDELFESVSPLRTADPIQLTGELFKAYHSIAGEREETVDEFFFFGEILLKERKRLMNFSFSEKSCLMILTILIKI